MKRFAMVVVVSMVSGICVAGPSNDLARLRMLDPSYGAYVVSTNQTPTSIQSFVLTVDVSIPKWLKAMDGEIPGAYWSNGKTSWVAEAVPAHQLEKIRSGIVSSVTNNLPKGTTVAEMSRWHLIISCTSVLPQRAVSRFGASYSPEQNVSINVFLLEKETRSLAYARVGRLGCSASDLLSTMDLVHRMVTSEVTNLLEGNWSASTLLDK